MSINGLTIGDKSESVEKIVENRTTLFSQIGCPCKIPSPLLPHSMLNKKFQPGATLYGGRGVADGFDSLFTNI